MRDAVARPAAPAVPSALIDVRTLAREYLSVSTPTCWRMLSSVRLIEPLRLTAQTLRWRRADVEAWIAGGCLPPKEQRPAGANGEASVNHHAAKSSGVTA